MCGAFLLKHPRGVRQYDIIQVSWWDDVGVLASKLGIAVGAMVTACVGTAVGADVIVGSTTHRPNSRVTVEMISVA